MKVIVYWPSRVFPERTSEYREVQALRVQGAHGYSIRGKESCHGASSIDECEIVLLPDDEDDIGQC